LWGLSSVCCCPTIQLAGAVADFRRRGNFPDILGYRRIGALRRSARIVLPATLSALAMNEIFRKFAQRVSQWAGSPWAFVIAAFVLVAWGVSGPLFGFSDTWQLVINTGTTIATFLMVFLIQNTQNRDSKAVNLKLDEIIRVWGEARNNMVDLENASDEEEALGDQFQRLRAPITWKRPNNNPSH
jgi:low affinity Fe/Cu permease